MHLTTNWFGIVLALMRTLCAHPKIEENNNKRKKQPKGDVFKSYAHPFVIALISPMQPTTMLNSINAPARSAPNNEFRRLFRWIAKALEYFDQF